MNTNHAFRFPAIVIACWFAFGASTRADRGDDYKKLDAEYKETEKKYFEERKNKKETTPADNIRNWENWPGWQYLPRFVALAEANPTDDAAYESCQWVIARTGNVGTESREIFAADQKAWQIIAAHHAKGDRIPELCVEATRYLGPAREKFLRDLLKQQDFSKENGGFATLALAEVLTNKCNYLESRQRENMRPSTSEFLKFVRSRQALELGQYVKTDAAMAYKDESMKLLHTVLDHYSDVPIPTSIRHYRRASTLGEKAEQDLYAIEHLSVGAEAPDIVGNDLDGKPLKLTDYRGHVVVLSFWFTGCGPCMAMFPKERKLVETFKDRPFALLGISGDTDLELARKTAKEEQIDWSCWFDGGNINGPISRQYNVTGWPIFYLIDKNGRIAIRDMDRDYLENDVAALLDKEK